MARLLAVALVGVAVVEGFSCRSPIASSLISSRAQQQSRRGSPLPVPPSPSSAASRMSLKMIDPTLASSLLLLADEPAYSVGYSGYSLYTTLGLYLLSLPGLFSLVTRSVKASAVQKTYDLPGPINPTSKPLRTVAAEIMAYFKAMNYEATVTEEVITFTGTLGRSNSQAAFLTFCTFVGLGSLGLVLSILIPDVGSKAYLLTLASPYAGIYYWNNAQREDRIKVKMETSDDEQTTSIICEGGKEDLERFSKVLQLNERGKVYIRGIFEAADEVIDPSVLSAAGSAEERK